MDAPPPTSLLISPLPFNLFFLLSGDKRMLNPLLGADILFPCVRFESSILSYFSPPSSRIIPLRQRWSGLLCAQSYVLFRRVSIFGFPGYCHPPPPDFLSERDS